MQEDVHATLRRRASQAMLCEKGKTSLQLQLGRMQEEGVPDLALIPVEEAVKSMKKATKDLKKECGDITKGEPIANFVEDTAGLSTAVFVFLGCLPPLTGFEGPSHLWSYCGLAVTKEGRAPSGKDLSALKKENSKKGWSPRLRAYAIVRLGEPCIKLRKSPYRNVYDERKQRTLFTHPPMLEEGAGCEGCDAAYAERRKKNKKGFDCAYMGGIHWTDGHRHADARRVMAKAILKDLWLVENGLNPVVGGQQPLEPQDVLDPVEQEHHTGLVEEVA